MLFSVVIPVYNVEQYLRACLDAVMPQVLACTPGAEVLLVDDGSTDKSGEICEEYAGKYPEFVRVFHKQNEGLLLTRRYGYRYAKGEYIINCDSDDLLAPDALQSLEKVIRQTDADVVLFNAERLYEDGRRGVYFENIFSDEEISEVTKAEALEQYLTAHSIVSLCCKCYRRSCIDEALDYQVYGRLSQAEDFMQSAEIYAKANRLVYYNRSLYYYRVGSGMTATFQRNYYKESKTVFQHVRRYLDAAQLDMPDWQGWLAQRFFIFSASAVMQSRNDRALRHAERKKYLTEIREDPLFEEYASRFAEVSGVIQRRYRLMNGLLIGRHYRLIDGMLRVRNLLGR